ncbi:lysis protein [Pseudomonas juntendi]|uniref:lysis protein n=1 Tax=Pseudomonas juntendi TaxID=2666183 RepID=UPI002949D3CB|nr:lysis protein [Pseudomonas juntendi]MDV5387599.1 lysis protein [Pseudomonas juntendi]
MNKYLLIALFALAAVLVGLTLKHDRDQLTSELQASTAEISRLKAEAESSRLALVARDALDKKNFEEMTNAKNEIGALRDQLAAGTKRVLVRAACPSAVPAAPGATGVDDARDAELTADARQDYLRIREQIVTTEAQLKGLKEYVRKVVQGVK